MGCVFRRLPVTLSLTFYLQGAFDSFEHEHLPRTKYDIIVDESSNKPGEQAFEVSTGIESSLNRIFDPLFLKKLISGRYLGEIMRLVICELIDEGVLFLGQNTYKLENPYVFDTAFLSLMERFCYLALSKCYKAYGLASQRSNGRTFDDHRNLFTLLCCRNHARRTSVLPCTCQAHWATCGQIEFLRYCGYCEQNGVPWWGLSSWRWRLSL